MTVHLFGAASSPALRKCAEDGGQFRVVVVQTVVQNFVKFDATEEAAVSMCLKNL